MAKEIKVLVFDTYGTPFDVHSVTATWVVVNTLTDLVAYLKI